MDLYTIGYHTECNCLEILDTSGWKLIDCCEPEVWYSIEMMEMYISITLGKMINYTVHSEMIIISTIYNWNLDANIQLPMLYSKYKSLDGNP